MKKTKNYTGSLTHSCFQFPPSPDMFAFFLFFAALAANGHARRGCATAFSKSASIPLASLEMAATLAQILVSVQPYTESKRLCTLVQVLGICSVMCSEALSIST